jgi:hypothetical protein
LEVFGYNEVTNKYLEAVLKTNTLMFLFLGAVVAGVILFFFFVGGWTIQYDVDFWASYIQHKPVHVPFIPCAIAGIFLSEFSIPIALVTWIISFII